MPVLLAYAQDWRGVYSLYDFDTPVQKLVAPKGYKIVYLSHYGRHGARYINSEDEYRVTRDVFKAELAQGGLTDAGHLFWKSFAADSASFMGRAGDLSALGRSQHQELGRRYRESFPQLFKKGCVRAESSTVPRCIASMYCFMEGCGISGAQYCEVDSSHMPYMSVAKQMDYKNSDRYTTISDLVDCDAVFSRLFVDGAKTLGMQEKSAFITALFYFCAHLGCIGKEDGTSELVFSPEELSILASMDDRKFHFNSGWDCPDNVYAAKVLLEEMLRQAHEDLSNGDVKVRLRFGHDGTIMKLMSLLAFGQWSGTDWSSSQVCMASNICLAFAQNRQGGIIVQVRYNEQNLSGWMALDELEKKLK